MDRMNVFTTAEQFEQYCSDVSERLRHQRDARTQFLRYAIGRLEPLLHVASALGDAQTHTDLSENLSAARADLLSMERLVLDPLLDEPNPGA